jgi:hypothetical protein
MKSCVDTAIASRCGGVVEWHRSKAASWRIIAAAIGVDCEKREVSCLSFLRRMRKEDKRNDTKEHGIQRN